MRPDQLLILETGRLRMLVCTAREAALTAARRHSLSEGSAAALAQAMTGALLLAAHDGARVDLQLDCAGPLRGLLADAEPDGAVRGLVRAGDLDRHGARAGAQSTEPPSAAGRFDARPVLSSAHDERAGALSILRAEPGRQSPHRAAFPFAGGDLGAALTLYLRNDREAGGELALEVLLDEGGLAQVAGVLIAPLDQADDVRALGKPLRQGGLREAMRGAADALRLASALQLGELTMVRDLAPRFACRCSKERVLHALATLPAPELRDMAEKDGGAEITCDFCAEKYALTSADLLSLKDEA